MIPMSNLFEYLESLRDRAGCRDVQISLDHSLEAVRVTFRYADGTRRFVFADSEIVYSPEDLIMDCAGTARREQLEAIRETT